MSRTILIVYSLLGDYDRKLDKNEWRENFYSMREWGIYFGPFTKQEEISRRIFLSSSERSH